MIRSDARKAQAADEVPALVQEKFEQFAHRPEAWIRADERKQIIEQLRVEHGSRHHAAIHVLLGGKCIEPLCGEPLLSGFVVCKEHELQARIGRLI